ncbi:MAG TPA: hypothetical protein VJM50_17550 [Pyrinomonadaceae bacterium]|nr:hypothetical protein [Pyrinomonadaceae bacterium]
MSDERTAAIKAALSSLKGDRDADWTQGGLPDMERMKEITGFADLKRDEVGIAAPGFNRANAGAAPSGLAQVGKSITAKAAGPTVTDEQEEEPAPADPLSPSDLAANVKDPVLLIEAANLAMLADPRYSKNSELQAFMRHYLIAQGNIKAHQKRLDDRYARVGA